MQIKSWRPHKYCKWPEDVTQQQMVFVARRQWLISSSTHEDENTLVVWKELYFNQWHKATHTVGLQWSQRSQTPEHSETLITDNFVCRSLTEHGCKLIYCTNVMVSDQRCRIWPKTLPQNCCFTQALWLHYDELAEVATVYWTRLWTVSHCLCGAVYEQVKETNENKNKETLHCNILVIWAQEVCAWLFAKTETFLQPECKACISQ